MLHIFISPQHKTTQILTSLFCFYTSGTIYFRQSKNRFGFNTHLVFHHWQNLQYTVIQNNMQRNPSSDPPQIKHFPTDLSRSRTRMANWEWWGKQKGGHETPLISFLSCWLKTSNGATFSSETALHQTINQGQKLVFKVEYLFKNMYTFLKESAAPLRSLDLYVFIVQVLRSETKNPTYNPCSAPNSR